jgi:hypothetical protein
MNPLNTAMRTQMKTLKKHIRVRKVNPIKEPSPSASKWVKDGVDHINVLSSGETEVGRSLAHSSITPFKHSVFGDFKTMEGFWFYIHSEERDDRLRTMTGTTLKRFAKKLTKIHVTNFRAVIMDSNYQRIMQNQFLFDLVNSSDLPFDCYFVLESSGERQRPIFFKWYIMGLEEIRAAIKEDREPNFNFLMDKAKTGVYQFASPTYHQKLNVVQEQAVA